MREKQKFDLYNYYKIDSNKYKISNYNKWVKGENTCTSLSVSVQRKKKQKNIITERRRKCLKCCVNCSAWSPT